MDVKVNNSGDSRVIVLSAVQPAASSTTTLYAPADKPEKIVLDPKFKPPSIE